MNEPPPLKERPFRVRLAIVFGVAILYAALARFLFAKLGQAYQIVSFSFIFLMPLALGALVCYLGYWLDRPRRIWTGTAPCLAMLLALAGSFVANLEAMMCLVVALPLVVPISVVGAKGMHYSLQKRSKDRLLLSLAVLLPYVVSPLEQMWMVPHEVRTMHDSIRISATPSEIWSQISSVPAIRREELPFQWIYLMGFPRPISAEINLEGVGGKRHATFERDVSFFEEVTEWNKPQRLSFTIEADPDFIPHTAFDEHIIVGGRFYDVLDGTYEIEALPEGGCILHLSSTHRLSTPFNWYAGWWSEWVMSQIQGSILTVIRARCER